MIDAKTIEEFTRRISDALPQNAQVLQQDIEKNVRAVVSSGFERLDLVTREEFEVQCGVLARTREKLEALEKQVAELEAELNK